MLFHIPQSRFAYREGRYRGRKKLGAVRPIIYSALLTLRPALVESYLGRTLEKMQLPENDQNENENVTRLNTAIWKLNEVYNESDGHYGDVQPSILSLSNR